MTNATKMVSSHRSFVLRSKSGHVVAFTKGEPRDVPQAVVREAMEVGCGIVEGDVGKLFEDAGSVRANFGGALRDSLLYLACKRIKARNDSTEFTAGGVPRVPAVEKLVGFDVTQKDVETMYRRVVSDEKSNEEVTLHPGAERVMRIHDAEDKDEVLLVALDAFSADEYKQLEGIGTLRQLRAAVLKRFAEVN